MRLTAEHIRRNREVAEEIAGEREIDALLAQPNLEAQPIHHIAEKEGRLL